MSADIISKVIKKYVFSENHFLSIQFRISNQITRHCWRFGTNGREFFYCRMIIILYLICYFITNNGLHGARNVAPMDQSSVVLVHDLVHIAQCMFFLGSKQLGIISSSSCKPQKRIKNETHFNFGIKKVQVRRPKRGKKTNLYEKNVFFP